MPTILAFASGLLFFASVVCFFDHLTTPSILLMSAAAITFGLLAVCEKLERIAKILRGEDKGQ